MLPIILGIAGALLAKGMTKDDVMKEVERRADLLDKAYYTTEDVAKISGLSEYTVRKKIRDGELPAEGEGNRSGYQIRKDALMEFLVNQRSCIRNRERAANTWTEEEIGAYTARRAAASAVAKAVTGSSSLGAAVTGAALASGVPGLRSSEFCGCGCCACWRIGRKRRVARTAGQSFGGGSLRRQEGGLRGGD